MDQHFTTISALQKELQAAPAPVATNPEPVVTACTKPAQVTDTNASEQHLAVNTLMSKLVAMAFACDLTRVASVQLQQQ